MTDNHPITPPFELVEQWYDAARGPRCEQELATQAARWGADQELEACIEWLWKHQYDIASVSIRAARRPKQPSLKEQAKAELNRLIALVSTEGALSMAEPIRCALEQLDALP